MALRVGVQKANSNAVNGFFRRFSHVTAITPSFHNLFHPISSPPLSLPESETQTETEAGCHPQLPTFSSHLGSMDLMAVPKQKISKHKRGIRNGPKALKPIPVIVRCKCCGRVKLPHFYCCSGRKEEPHETSNENN